MDTFVSSLEHIIDHFNNDNLKNLFFNEINKLNFDKENNYLFFNVENLYKLSKEQEIHKDVKLTLQEKIIKDILNKELDKKGYLFIKEPKNLDFFAGNKNFIRIGKSIYITKEKFKNSTLKRRLNNIINKNMFLAATGIDIKAAAQLCNCYSNCHGDCHSNCHHNCKAAAW